jgi:DNA-binding NarL/FixJ family response regulator
MRIILADHHPEPLAALSALLDELPEFDLIGETADGQGLLVLAGKHAADLVLMDSDLPGITIEDLITRLHALEPSPIVLGMSSEFENSRRMLKSGADAFVSKGDEPEWLLEKLHKYAKQVKMRRMPIE